MKRSMAGGAHRGPVAHDRQRKTIRFVQILLVLVAAGLLLFAGYSAGRSSGYDAGVQATEEESAPRKPSTAQTIVLSVLALGALGGAYVLGGPEGVRIPTPARLDELAGRAESAAVQKAEELAAEKQGN